MSIYSRYFEIGQFGIAYPLEAVYLRSTMAEVAQQLGYSYGHCANVEAAAIKRLCRHEMVKDLLKPKSKS